MAALNGPAGAATSVRSSNETGADSERTRYSRTLVVPSSSAADWRAATCRARRVSKVGPLATIGPSQIEPTLVVLIVATAVTPPSAGSHPVAWTGIGSDRLQPHGAAVAIVTGTLTGATDGAQPRRTSTGEPASARKLVTLAPDRMRALPSRRSGTGLSPGLSPGTNARTDPAV